MPSTVPHIQIGVLSEFPRLLRRRGADVDALFVDVGLSTADLANPDTVVALAVVLKLFESAAVACKDSSFGLHYAEEFPVGGTGLLGQLIYSAPTVRDVVKTIAHYGRIHVDSIITYQESEGLGRLNWDFPVGLGTPHFQYSMFGMAVVLIRLRTAIGPLWRPPAVSVAEPMPADAGEYDRVLGTKVRFGERRNMMTFDARMLEQRIPQKVERLHATLKTAGDRELAEVERRSDIVAAVRHQIASTFGTDAPFDLDAVSAALGVASRALQWRLGQYGTTYERILGEIRRDVAERMLREGRLPMTEIAGHLRFSELSAFTRAAHRWFGMSPSEHRRKLRGDSGGEGSGTSAT